MPVAFCMVHTQPPQLLAHLLQAAVGCHRPIQPASKQIKLQPPQACNPVTKAASSHHAEPKPTSTWEQFVDAEAETSQAAAELDSPPGLLTTTDSSQKLPLQSHITAVDCRRESQPEGHTVSSSGSDLQQQAQQITSKYISTSKPGSLPQAEPKDTTWGQRSQATEQPSDQGVMPNVTPAATACKPLVPIFSKRRQHVFKPPALVAGHQQTSPSKPPSRQTSCSVLSAQGAGNKPAFVFDELHALARHAVVPTSFVSLHGYQQSWCAAVTEEINIRCTTHRFCSKCLPDHTMDRIASMGTEQLLAVFTLRTKLHSSVKTRRLMQINVFLLPAVRQHSQGAFASSG